MAQYIDKAAVVAEIERISCENPMDNSWYVDTEELLNFINTLEVRDPHEKCVQYLSVKDEIESHAETYSFNIESELFHQLTKEQQKLWRKEIEEACISGGYAGYQLAKDPRYKENLEAKEVDLEKEVNDYGYHYDYVSLADRNELVDFAKHFFKLGMQVSNKAQKGE